ncbi:MAG: hypothetical protein QOG63_1146 [Thermoleophilaceae bacterium]|nr:hypothetical protein [Thermoleophilaceae bacterium]
MPVVDLAIGSEFAGYRLEAVAGRGGMGVVYRARNLITEQQRALKVIAPQLSADEGFRDRFRRESRLAARLEHPNVIPLHEAREENGLLYLVMRYVEGTDLAKLLRSEGRLEPRRALDIIGQVAAALDAAHEQGLVHRDVKPANVLLEPRPGGEEHAYLTDFGLVKDVGSDSSLSVTGVFVGTYQYAAPEQIDPSGGKQVDRRTDVYALGCVLYHVLCGEVPYPRPSVQGLIAAHLFMEPPNVSLNRPDLPPQLDRVIHRAMAKEQDARYYTAGQMVRAARGALEGARTVPPATELAPPAMPRMDPPSLPPDAVPTNPLPPVSPPPFSPPPVSVPPPISPPPTWPLPASWPQPAPAPWPPPGGLPPPPRRKADRATLFAASLTAAGAVAAIVSLFVIWHMWNKAFKDGHLVVVHLNGWEAFGLGDIAIVAAAVVALAAATAVVLGRGPRLPLRALEVLSGAGIAAIAIYVVVWDPDAHELVAGADGPTNQGHGPLVAACAGALIAAGGVLGALLDRRARIRAAAR